MTNKSELSWQADIVKAINTDGGYGRKVDSHLQKGFPDLVAVWQGRTVFIEVKLLRFAKSVTIFKPNLKRKILLTELQRIEIAKICAAGGAAHVLVIMQAEDMRPKDAVMGLVDYGMKEATSQNTQLFDKWEDIRRGNVMDNLLKTGAWASFRQ